MALGSAPCIEAFLEKIEPAARDNLFRELLAIDVELRLEHGEQPRAQEYRERFPDRAAAIDRTFQKRWAGRTPTNRGEGRDSGGNGVPSTDETGNEQVLPERLGRYIPTAILGGGGFGTVYLARDEELNRQVAIKVPKTEAMASR